MRFLITDKGSPGASYTQQMAQSFLMGKLSLQEIPSKELLELSDPYDPALNVRFRAHDASLYQGKYYSYFSPVSSLLILAPFKLVTNRHLGDPLVASMFGFLGFLFSCLIYKNVLKQNQISTTISYDLAIFLVFALASNVAFVLRRSTFYEVPIMAAYAFLMAFIFFLLPFIGNRKISNKKILLIGTFAGLCFANRPNQLLVIFLLILGSLYIKCAYNKFSIKEFGIQFFALIVPIILILFLMGWYNYARFESITEFGMSYMLAGIDLRNVPMVSPLRTPFGFFVYLFHSYTMDFIYPFFHTTYAPKPESPISKIWFTEPLVGILCYPVFWLFLAPIITLNSLYKRYKELTFIALLLGLAGFLEMLFLSSLPGVTMRYMVDFMPLLLLGGSILLAAFTAQFIQDTEVVRVWYSYLYICVGITCLITIFLSLTGYYEILKMSNPELYNMMKNFFYWPLT